MSERAKIKHKDDLNCRA